MGMVRGGLAEGRSWPVQQDGVVLLVCTRRLRWTGAFPELGIPYHQRVERPSVGGPWVPLAGGELKPAGLVLQGPGEALVVGLGCLLVGWGMER